MIDAARHAGRFATPDGEQQFPRLPRPLPEVARRPDRRGAEDRRCTPGRHEGDRPTPSVGGRLALAPARRAPTHRDHPRRQCDAVVARLARSCTRTAPPGSRPPSSVDPPIAVRAGRGSALRHERAEHGQPHRRRTSRSSATWCRGGERRPARPDARQPRRARTARRRAGRRVRLRSHRRPARVPTGASGPARPDGVPQPRRHGPDRAAPRHRDTSGTSLPSDPGAREVPARPHDRSRGRGDRQPDIGRPEPLPRDPLRAVRRRHVHPRPGRVRLVGRARPHPAGDLRLRRCDDRRPGAGVRQRARGRGVLTRRRARVRPPPRRRHRDRRGVDRTEPGRDRPGPQAGDRGRAGLPDKGRPRSGSC